MLRRTLDEGDASMAERKEVLPDETAARALVDADGQDRSPRLLSCGHCNDLDPGARGRFDKLEVVRQRRRKDQPGGSLRFEDRREQPDAIVVLWIHGSGDKVEAERRAASQSAKLQARVVIAVGLQLGTMGMDEH